MKLTYRGAHYEYTPATEVAGANDRTNPAQAPYRLMYRGASYLANPAVEPVVDPSRPAVNLTYRGATYGLNGGAPVPATERVVVKPVTTARSKRAAVQAAMAVTHRQNLQQNLQRRLQVAQARGDQQLVQLLESELRQIAW